MTFPSQQVLLGETGKEQKRSERGKMSRSLPDEVKEVLCSTRGRSQGDLSAHPWTSLTTSMQFYRLFFLETMYTSYQLLTASAHTYALYTHSSKIPLDAYMYARQRSHPSLHLYSTHIRTPVYSSSPFYIYIYKMRGGEGEAV